MFKYVLKIVDPKCNIDYSFVADRNSALEWMKARNNPSNSSMSLEIKIHVCGNPTLPANNMFIVMRRFAPGVQITNKNCPKSILYKYGCRVTEQFYYNKEYGSYLNRENPFSAQYNILVNRNTRSIMDKVEKGVK